MAKKKSQTGQAIILFGLVSGLLSYLWVKNLIENNLSSMYVNPYVEADDYPQFEDPAGYNYRGGS